MFLQANIQLFLTFPTLLMFLILVSCQLIFTIKDNWAQWASNKIFCDRNCDVSNGLILLPTFPLLLNPHHLLIRTPDLINSVSYGLPNVNQLSFGDHYVLVHFDKTPFSHCIELANISIFFIPQQAYLNQNQFHFFYLLWLRCFSLLNGFLFFANTFSHILVCFSNELKLNCLPHTGHSFLYILAGSTSIISQFGQLNGCGQILFFYSIFLPVWPQKSSFLNVIY